jgi:hypothetical protein
MDACRGALVREEGKEYRRLPGGAVMSLKELPAIDQQNQQSPSAKPSNPATAGPEVRQVPGGDVITLAELPTFDQIQAQKQQAIAEPAEEGVPPNRRLMASSVAPDGDSLVIPAAGPMLGASEQPAMDEVDESWYEVSEGASIAL